MPAVTLASFEAYAHYAFRCRRTQQCIWNIAGPSVSLSLKERVFNVSSEHKYYPLLLKLLKEIEDDSRLKQVLIEGKLRDIPVIEESPKERKQPYVDALVKKEKLNTAIN